MTIDDMHFTYVCMMRVFDVMPQPRKIKKTSHFSTMFVRVIFMHRAMAAPQGHRRLLGAHHEHIGKMAGREPAHPAPCHRHLRQQRLRVLALTAQLPQLGLIGGPNFTFFLRSYFCRTKDSTGHLSPISIALKSKIDEMRVVQCHGTDGACGWT